MNTTKENLADLKEFLHNQALDDAGMPAEDRRHNRQVVKDVIDQEPLKPNERQDLFNEYSGETALLARAA